MLLGIADLRSLAVRVIRRVSAGARKRQARMKQSRLPQRPSSNADHLQPDPSRVLSFGGTKPSEGSKSSNPISALRALRSLSHCPELPVSRHHAAPPSPQRWGVLPVGLRAEHRSFSKRLICRSQLLEPPNVSVPPGLSSLADYCYLDHGGEKTCGHISPQPRRNTEALP